MITKNKLALFGLFCTLAAVLYFGIEDRERFIYLSIKIKYEAQIKYNELKGDGPKVRDLHKKLYAELLIEASKYPMKGFIFERAYDHLNEYNRNYDDCSAKHFLLVCCYSYHNDLDMCRYALNSFILCSKDNLVYKLNLATFYHDIGNTEDAIITMCEATTMYEKGNYPRSLNIQLDCARTSGNNVNTQR